MTIESLDQIPLDHFSGGSNITGDTVDDLRGIILQWDYYASEA